MGTLPAAGTVCPVGALTVAILTDLDRELDDPETVSELRTLKLSREWVSKPGWVPSRGKPRLPSLLKIAGYWADLGVVDDIQHPILLQVRLGTAVLRGGLGRGPLASGQPLPGSRAPG